MVDNNLYRGGKKRNKQEWTQGEMALRGWLCCEHLRTPSSVTCLQQPLMAVETNEGEEAYVSH